MSILFRTAFQAEDSDKKKWFEPTGVNATISRERSRLKVWDDTRYRMKLRGEEFGPWRPKSSDVLTRSRDLLTGPRMDVGDMIVIEADKKGFILIRKVHIVDVDYPRISSNATPNVKRLIQPLWDEYPELEYWGCFSCRRIANSSSWSEHSWADALDIHSPTMSYGDQAVSWMRRNAGRLNITRVLWREWNHYDHFHVDLDPDHSGTPPCA